MESGEDNGKDTTASSYECGKRSGATKVVNDSNGTARQRQQQLKQSPNPWALERIEQMERLGAHGGRGRATWPHKVRAQLTRPSHVIPLLGLLLLQDSPRAPAQKAY
ncbi:GM25691 [Drosophila sechellia]|uniref:GM25691 n=1 Tax=Drosophila sechellia TaxID=7238 RepID=B4HKB7_DROSE|nr:GM25691 [Drosophila sechellia]